MSSQSFHGDFLLGRSKRNYTLFNPTTISDFRSLSDSDFLKDMEDSRLLRMWIRPVERLIQWTYGINPNRFSGTLLGELESDFVTATVLSCDYMALNREHVSGPENVGGASRVWTQKLPEFVSALMERYATYGGRVTRA